MRLPSPVMKTFLILSLSALALFARAQTSNAPAPAASAEPVSAEIAPQPILATLKRVADWQLAHPVTTQRYSERAWTYGAVYAGVMALNEIAGTTKYHDAMKAIGVRFEWQPAPRIFFADDHCVAQMYLQLYLLDHDPAML